MEICMIEWNFQWREARTSQKRENALLLSVISFQLKCIWQNVGVSFSHGMVLIWWGNIQCKAEPHQFSSVAQSCLTAWPHGLQHSRLPCPSPIPAAYLSSCPSSWWCHPTISFSVIPFSSRLQSFPASGSFPMSHFFASGSQSIGVSASASVLPMNIQDWFPLGLIGWISLQSKGLSSLLQHHSSKVINYTGLNELMTDDYVFCLEHC